MTAGRTRYARGIRTWRGIARISGRSAIDRQYVSCSRTNSSRSDIAITTVAEVFAEATVAATEGGSLEDVAIDSRDTGVKELARRGEAGGLNRKREPAIWRRG